MATDDILSRHIDLKFINDLTELSHATDRIIFKYIKNIKNEAELSYIKCLLEKSSIIHKYDIIDQLIDSLLYISNNNRLSSKL